MYTATWTAFFGATRWPVGSVPATVLLLAGTFAPSLAAVTLIARENGQPGLRALWRRVLDVNVSWRWYAFAVGYLAVLKLLAATAHRLLVGVWLAFGTTPLILIPFAILISMPVQAGEEIGWRGYALPRLAEHFGFAREGALLGLLWECGTCRCSSSPVMGTMDSPSGSLSSRILGIRLPCSTRRSSHGWRQGF
jgi:uncharacterized protein